MTGTPARVVVAEISSFQLDLARSFTPETAVLLNVSPDHLDRYADITDYCRSKWSIFTHQTAAHAAIVNADMDDTCPDRPRTAARLYEFSSTPDTVIRQGAKVENQTIRLILPETSPHHPMQIDCENRVRVPGIHNLENMAAAALATLCAGGNISGIAAAAGAFTGLPHRLAFVTEIDGIRFFNDSKATNTDAVVRALSCFTQPVVLIIGGREKHTDFTLLKPALSQVRQIIAMGEAARHIHDVFSPGFPVAVVSDMAAAVTAARAAARSGDAVLLSPACASFDLFDNYAARGDAFIRHVLELEVKNHG